MRDVANLLYRSSTLLTQPFKGSIFHGCVSYPRSTGNLKRLCLFNDEAERSGGNFIVVVSIAGFGMLYGRVAEEMPRMTIAKFRKLRATEY